VIIIDSDNYQEHGIETMFFPGGEPHVKVPVFNEDVMFVGKLRAWDDVGFAALLLDAICERQSNVVVSFIPYFPGARQDRSDGRAALTLDVMLRLLAESDCHTVVFDPHSSELADDPRVSGVFMPSDLRLPIRNDVVGIIAPDHGALERAVDFANTFYPSAAVIECSKTRDSQTGRLSNYHMPALPKAGRYIIVDDICDGGGTFNLLADAFGRDEIADQCRLEMFVSHGIFSRGLPAISSRIEHITTTDSFCTTRYAHSNPLRLTVIPLLEQLKSRLAEVLDDAA